MNEEKLMSYKEAWDNLKEFIDSVENVLADDPDYPHPLKKNEYISQQGGYLSPMALLGKVQMCGIILGLMEGWEEDCINKGE